MLHALRDTTSAAEGDGASTWRKWTSKGFNIRFKYDFYTGDLDLVGDIFLDLEPLRAWVILREFHLLPLWSIAMQSDLLHSFNKDSEFYCILNDRPMTFLPYTELYLQRTVIDLLDLHGMLIICTNSPPLDETSYRGITIPAATSESKRVVANMGDIITPLSSCRTKMTIYRRLCTGIPYLPNWVIGVAAGIIVEGIITKVYKLNDSWHGGTHETTLKSGPRAYYYKTIQSRLEKAWKQRSSGKT